MRWQAAAAGFAALSLLAGCAGASGKSATSTATSAATAQATPAPASSSGPSVATTDRQTMEQIVREWSRRLDAGDNAGAARLYGLPTLISQGGLVLQATTYAELTEWLAALPCSGTVTNLRFETDAVVAIFILGDRLTSSCDATPGTKAAARFVFRNGQIIGWEQIPVPGGGTTPSGPVV